MRQRRARRAKKKGARAPFFPKPKDYLLSSFFLLFFESSALFDGLSALFDMPSALLDIPWSLFFASPLPFVSSAAYAPARLIDRKPATTAITSFFIIDLPLVGGSRRERKVTRGETAEQAPQRCSPVRNRCTSCNPGLPSSLRDTGWSRTSP